MPPTTCIWFRFFDGEHMFTACAKAHQADCGNSIPKLLITPMPRMFTKKEL